MHQAIALPHGHGGKMPSIMFSPLKTVTWSSNSNNMIHFLRCQEVSVNSQYNKCSCSLDFNTSRMIIQAFPKKFQYLLAQKKKKIYIYIYIHNTFHSCWGDILWFMYTKNSVISGLMWRWCYTNYNLPSQQVVNFFVSSISITQEIYMTL